MKKTILKMSVKNKKKFVFLLLLPDYGHQKHMIMLANEFM